MRILRLTLWGIALMASAALTQVLTHELHSCWSFSPDGDQTSWLDAEAPGCLHTGLLRHQLIPDPPYRINEKFMQWVSEKDGLYRTEFTPGEELLAREEIELVCEGLDTYARVLLCGEEILRIDNMFRTRLIPAEVKAGLRWQTIYDTYQEEKGKEKE